MFKTYNFDLKNGIGYKLASVGPRKLIKKINYFILSIGMGFDYSNNVSLNRQYNLRT